MKIIKLCVSYIASALAITLSLSESVMASTPLLDRNGQTIRGTAMVIGKPYQPGSNNPSVSSTIDIVKWQEAKSLGLNTIRVAWIDPFVEMDPNWNVYWSVDEMLTYLDQAVANANQTGMNVIINYHNVAEYQKTNGFGRMEEFWQKVAPRYKDNDLVIYEINNEQAWSKDKYLSDHFQSAMRRTYEQVRRDAPDRRVIMFSFHSFTLDMKGIADAYDWVDWSNTAVGYHFYGEGSGPIESEVQNFENLYNSDYTIICTEWRYDGHADYTKRFYGEVQNSQTLERLNQSWLDWHDWQEVDVNKHIREILIPDAQAKDYLWDTNTKPIPVEPAKPFKLPGLIQAEDFHRQNGLTS